MSPVEADGGEKNTKHSATPVKVPMVHSVHSDASPMVRPVMSRCLHAWRWALAGLWIATYSIWGSTAWAGGGDPNAWRAPAQAELDAHVAHLARGGAAMTADLPASGFSIAASTEWRGYSYNPRSTGQMYLELYSRFTQRAGQERAFIDLMLGQANISYREFHLRMANGVPMWAQQPMDLFHVRATVQHHAYAHGVYTGDTRIMMTGTGASFASFNPTKVGLGSNAAWRTYNPAKSDIDLFLSPTPEMDAYMTHRKVINNPVEALGNRQFDFVVMDHERHWEQLKRFEGDIAHVLHKGSRLDSASIGYSPVESNFLKGVHPEIWLWGLDPSTIFADDYAARRYWTHAFQPLDEATRIRTLEWYARERAKYLSFHREAFEARMAAVERPHFQRPTVRLK